MSDPPPTQIALPSASEPSDYGQQKLMLSKSEVAVHGSTYCFRWVCVLQRDRFQRQRPHESFGQVKESAASMAVQDSAVPIDRDGFVVLELDLSIVVFRAELSASQREIPRSLARGGQLLPAGEARHAAREGRSPVESCGRVVVTCQTLSNLSRPTVCVRLRYHKTAGKSPAKAARKSGTYNHKTTGKDLAKAALGPGTSGTGTPAARGLSSRTAST